MFASSSAAQDAPRTTQILARPVLSATENVTDNQGSSSKHDQDRKRKRNTIACFQCRTRKRRCDADAVEDCENCVRDGLECRRPDVDGRKTRWKKERNLAGVETGQRGPFGPDEGSETMQGELDGTFTSCLFDMFMGANPTRGDQSTIVAGQNPIPEASPTDRDTMSAWNPQDEGDSSSHRYPDLSGQFPGNLWSRLSPTSSARDPARAWPQQSAQSTQPSHVKKVVWWRPHGPSAIAPGLKRITLKVRLDNKVESPTQNTPHPILGHPQQDIIDEGGMPRHDLMIHLLDVFMTHFGCQFPALSKTQLQRDLEQRSGSTLLFNCIASTASRFSKHPEIALPELEPHSYGLVFLKTAKSMLGNMLAVPTRETVIALVLLAGISHGIDSESEEWMAAGMAVRMAIDLGLHLAPPPGSAISEAERRLNRLTFWSVYFLDVYLSFGVGRETAFRLAAISQTLPTDDDFQDESDGNPLGTRSAFPHAAKLAFAYGPLVNVVNGPRNSPSESDHEAQRITQQAVEIYNALPSDMQWSAYNLQNLSNANQGSIFVQMHLWMHTVLASGYLIGTDVLRPGRKIRVHGSTTPSNNTATRLWQNSARTIGDILILSDIVNPFVYHALPFSNQPFVVAGCCYIKEADAQRQRQITKHSNTTRQVDQGISASTEDQDAPPVDLPDGSAGAEVAGASGEEEKVEMYRTLLQSVTSNNITALRQGLIRQTRYWAGVAWVAEVLSQRMSGISMDDIDLRAVTEGLDSTVAITDARMFSESSDTRDPGHRGSIPSHHQQPFDPASFLRDMQLPLEADWLADTALLQSQGYPVVVEDFTSDWANNYLA